MLWSCPYVLFSYYSHICAFCPLLALYSPLVFLQQQLLESLIRAKKWGVFLLRLFTFWFVWCPNFARTALLTLCLLSPSCSSFLTLCHDSVLVLSVFFRGLMSLLFLWFHCLMLCMMYALFDMHLTLLCRDQPFWVDSMIFHFFVIESTQKVWFYDKKLCSFLFVNFGANFFQKSRQQTRGTSEWCWHHKMPWHHSETKWQIETHWCTSFRLTATMLDSWDITRNRRCVRCGAARMEIRSTWLKER
jgi:hypothetical protein